MVKLIRISILCRDIGSFSYQLFKPLQTTSRHRPVQQRATIPSSRIHIRPSLYSNLNTDEVASVYGFSQPHLQRIREKLFWSGSAQNLRKLVNVGR